MFRNRSDAGRQLAERVAALHLLEPLVLALPRGGVPVAAEVASALGAPLHAFVARKVGAPGRPEYGVGAIAEGSDEVVVTSAVERNWGSTRTACGRWPGSSEPRWSARSVSTAATSGSRPWTPATSS